MLTTRRLLLGAAAGALAAAPITIRPVPVGIWSGAGGAHLIEDNTIIDAQIGIWGGGREKDRPDRYVDNTIWLRTPLPGAVAISANHASAVGNLIVGYSGAGAAPFDGLVRARDNTILP